jgi:hypothetical protein
MAGLPFLDGDPASQKLGVRGGGAACRPDTFLLSDMRRELTVVVEIELGWDWKEPVGSRRTEVKLLKRIDQ